MLEVPSLEQLREEANAAVIAETELNAVTRPRSVEAFFAQSVAEVAFGLYAWLSKALRRFLSKYFAREWARFLGVIPKDGAVAHGNIIVTGTNGAVLPAGRTFSYALTGAIYEVVSSVTIVGGTATAEVQALESGVEGNVAAGQVLDIQVSTAGIDPSATVDVDGLYDGTEPESDDELWQRVQLEVQSPGEIPTPVNIEKWARSVDGVTRAKCLPAYYGPGHTLVLCVNDTLPGLTPSSTTLSDVYAYIEERLVEPRGILVVSASQVKTVNITFANLGSVTTDERSVILKQLKDLFLRRSGWGEAVNPIEIDDCAAAVVSRLRYSLTAPLTIQSTTELEVLSLGTVTWS
jgi:uncharacterized phage protein gp47/JayE